MFAAAAAKLLQSCPTLCDPIDGSPPGSSVPGILQARILEWGAIGDRIKLTWGPWGQSRASSIQSGKLEARDVRGPDK